MSKSLIVSFSLLIDTVVFVEVALYVWSRRIAAPLFVNKWLVGCLFRIPCPNPLSLSGLRHSAFVLQKGQKSLIGFSHELLSFRSRDVVPIDDVHGGGGGKETISFRNLDFDVDRRPLGDAIL